MEPLPEQLLPIRNQSAVASTENTGRKRPLFYFDQNVAWCLGKNKSPDLGFNSRFAPIESSDYLRTQISVFSSIKWA